MTCSDRVDSKRLPSVAVQQDQEVVMTGSDQPLFRASLLAFFAIIAVVSATIAMQSFTQIIPKAG